MFSAIFHSRKERTCDSSPNPPLRVLAPRTLTRLEIPGFQRELKSVLSSYRGDRIIFDFSETEKLDTSAIAVFADFYSCFRGAQILIVDPDKKVRNLLDVLNIDGIPGVNFSGEKEEALYR